MIAQLENTPQSSIQLTKNTHENAQLHLQQQNQKAQDQPTSKQDQKGIPTLPTQEKEEGLMEDLDIEDLTYPTAKLPSPTKICVKLLSNCESEKAYNANIDQHKKQSEKLLESKADYDDNNEFNNQIQICQEDQLYFLDLKNSVSNKQAQNKLQNPLKYMPKDQTKIENEQSKLPSQLQIDKKISSQYRQVPEKLSDQIEFDFETVIMTSKSWLSNSQVGQSGVQDTRKDKKIENEHKQSKIIDEMHSCKSVSDENQENKNKSNQQIFQFQQQKQNSFNFCAQNILLKTAQKERLILANNQLSKHFSKYQNILNHQNLYDYYIDKIKSRIQSKRDLFYIMRAIIVHKSSSFAQTHNYMVNHYTGKIYQWDGLRKKSLKQGDAIEIFDSQEDLNQRQQYQNSQKNPYLNMGLFFSSGYKQMLNVRKQLKKSYDQISKKLYEEILQKLKIALQTYENKYQDLRKQVLLAKNQFVYAKVRFLNQIYSMKAMGQKINSNFEPEKDIFLEAVQFFNKEDDIKTKILIYSDAMNKFRKLFYQLEKEFIQQLLYAIKEYRNFSQQNYILIQDKQSQKLTIKDYIIFLESQIENQYSFERIFSEKQLSYLQQLYNSATCSEENCINPFVDNENQSKYEKVFILQDCLFKTYLKQNCISVRQLLKLTVAKAFLLKDPCLQLVITLKNQLVLLDWKRLQIIEVFQIQGLSMQMQILRQQLKNKSVLFEKIQQKEEKDSQTCSQYSPQRLDTIVQRKDQEGNYYLILMSETKNMFSSTTKYAKVEFASMDKLEQFIIIIQNWQK